jgi:hypothetical protein
VPAHREQRAQTASPSVSWLHGRQRREKADEWLRAPLGPCLHHADYVLITRELADFVGQPAQVPTAMTIRGFATGKRRDLGPLLTRDLDRTTRSRHIVQAAQAHGCVLVSPVADGLQAHPYCFGYGSEGLAPIQLKQSKGSLVHTG